MAQTLTRKKQVGIKLESAAGTKETLSASDYGIELNEVTTEVGLDVIENQVFSGSISNSLARMGKAVGTVTMAGEFKNSGTLNTKPRVGTILEMARFVPTAVKNCTVTGPTGQAGLVRGVSIVTGGTSGGTALVVKYVDTTTDVLYYAPISGTLQAGETITASGFSGTIGTISGTASGWLYAPSSAAASEKTGTVVVNDSGILKPLYGAVANLSLDLNTDSYPRFSATLTGIVDKTNWGTLATDVTGITFETNAPAVVNAAAILVAGDKTPITNQVTVDMGNTMQVIRDLNSSTWLKYGTITQRAPVSTMQILQLSPSTLNTCSLLFAGTAGAMTFSIGSAAGSLVEIFAPAAQFSGITDGDDNGLANQTLNFRLTGTDTEMYFWFQ